MALRQILQASVVAGGTGLAGIAGVVANLSEDTVFKCESDNSLFSAEVTIEAGLISPDNIRTEFETPSTTDIKDYDDIGNLRVQAQKAAQKHCDGEVFPSINPDDQSQYRSIWRPELG